MKKVILFTCFVAVVVVSWKSWRLIKDQRDDDQELQLFTVADHVARVIEKHLRHKDGSYPVTLQVSDVSPFLSNDDLQRLKGIELVSEISRTPSTGRPFLLWVPQAPNIWVMDGKGEQVFGVMLTHAPRDLVIP